MYTFDHDLFLALNFDGGAAVDRAMLAVSGTLLWVPLYGAIFWIVGRRYGWRMLLCFLVLLAAAMGAADIVAGVFKHSGPLGGLLPDFAPRWRPMFTPELEGLAVTPDSLRVLRSGALLADPAVHVPVGAVGGRFGTVSAHASTVCALCVLAAATIRRRGFTLFMVACTALICYSRLYLAKHFPMDLVWGGMLGVLLGGLGAKLFFILDRRIGRPSHRSGRA